MIRYIIIPLLSGALWGINCEGATLVFVIAFLLSLPILYLLRANRLFALLLVLSSVMGGASYSNLRMHLHGEKDKSTQKEKTSYVSRAEQSLEHAPIHPAHRAVIEATLLGDRSHLSTEQKQIYRQAGAQHVLALSGMHLSILLAMLCFLLNQSSALTRRRWFTAVFSLLLIWFYVYMTGAPKSLVRASLMASFFIFNKCVFRESSATDVLSSSVFLMFLSDPLVVTDIGAQLSVAAVAGIVFFHHEFSKTRWRGRRLLEYIVVSFSAWLFTMPLVAYHFGILQLWQPILGIVLVPLVSVTLYLSVLLLTACFVGVVWLVDVFGAVTDVSWNLVDALLYFCANLPFATIQIEHISFPHLLLFYLILIIPYVFFQERSTNTH